MRWSNEQILKFLNKFIKLEKLKPIKNNKYGVKFPHMFGLYFFLKKIKPKFVVESGIYKGQTTWLIEKTLPKAKVLSIDINLKSRSYISKSRNVKYSDLDFSSQNFEKIPKNSLVFFDDHQNCYKRLQEAYFFGFKHVIFEDNYPPGIGDFYSLSHVINGAGSTGKKMSYKDILIVLYKIGSNLIKRKINPNHNTFIDLYNWGLNDVVKNKKDVSNLNKVVEDYFIFPPIFKKKYTRWGEKWSLYKTKKPLFNENKKKKYPEIYKEADSYNWITYVKLK